MHHFECRAVTLQWFTKTNSVSIVENECRDRHQWWFTILVPVHQVKIKSRAVGSKRFQNLSFLSYNKIKVLNQFSKISSFWLLLAASGSWFKPNYIDISANFCIWGYQKYWQEKLSGHTKLLTRILVYQPSLLILSFPFKCMKIYEIRSKKPFIIFTTVGSSEKTRVNIIPEAKFQPNIKHKGFWRLLVSFGQFLVKKPNFPEENSNFQRNFCKIGQN